MGPNNSLIWSKNNCLKQESIYNGRVSLKKIPNSKKRLPMHHKDIKRMVRKQLKKQFPKWKRLIKKIKKEIADKVLTEMSAEYDFKQEVKAPIEELLAI